MECLDLSEKSDIKKAKNPNIGGKRDGSGRKPHQATQERRLTVSRMAGLGIPYEQIASTIGICHDTLVKYYPDDLSSGKAKANEQVARRLFERATDDGDVTALIWWTKTQMRWSAHKEEEAREPDSKPTVMVVPVVGSVDQWQKAAIESQQSLKASVKD